MRPLFNASWILLASSAIGCASPGPFIVRFSGQQKNRAFACEEQSIHAKSRPSVRAVESPGRTSLTLEAGDATVLWLYHFEDDGDSLQDREFAYTIAIELRDRRVGRWELPAPEVGVTFFCDHWGGGFRAAELHASKGMVRLMRVEEGVIEGEMDVTLVGYKERADRTREPLDVFLSGSFRAGEKR